METNNKKGFVFKQYEAPYMSPFDKLFEIFTELITHTSGDFDEAIRLVSANWIKNIS